MAATRPDLEDLTARARIRDAALRLFADRGIGAATIRDIARAAGVSSGLVRHHFGSKEALRDACDSYAVDRLNRLREQLLLKGGLADPATVSSVYPDAIVLQTYLVRSMMDGSAAATAMFDEAMRETERWLAIRQITPRDPRAYAAVLTAMQMGVFLMRDKVSRALGADIGTPAGHARMTRGFVEVFSLPLLTPELATQAHDAIDRVQATPAGGDPARHRHHEGDARR